MKKDILIIIIVSICWFVGSLLYISMHTPSLDKMVATGDTLIIYEEDVKNIYGTIEKGTIVIVTDSDHMKAWDNHIEVER